MKNRKTESSGFRYEDWLGCRTLAFRCQRVDTFIGQRRPRAAVRVQHLLIEASVDGDDTVHVSFDDVWIWNWAMTRSLLIPLANDETKCNIHGRLARAGNAQHGYLLKGDCTTMWARAMIDEYGVGSGETPDALDGMFNLTRDSLNRCPIADYIYDLCMQTRSRRQTDAVV